MAVLHNPRQEAFCHAILSGQSIEKAHKTAGYLGNRKAAWALRHRLDVDRRIAELIEERNAVEASARTAAIRKVAITKQDVLKSLISLAKVAEKRGQLGPAVRATELLGKELGMFIDRSLIKQTEDIYETMSDAELRREVADRLDSIRAQQREQRRAKSDTDTTS